jgi:hypothetical protein
MIGTYAVTHTDLTSYESERFCSLSVCCLLKSTRAHVGAVQYRKKLLQLEAQIAELKETIAIEEARVGKLHADGEPIEDELKPLKLLKDQLRQAEAKREAILGKK